MLIKTVDDLRCSAGDAKGTPDESPSPPGTPDPGSRRDDEAGRKPVLLLIEDDWQSHSALRKIFTKLDWDVQSAMTVAGGLSLLEQRPRGVILDLMLPDGDGLEILRKVRSERYDIRVVVTTGIEDRTRLEEIRRLRPDALLRKPIDLDELLRALGSGRPD